MLFVQEFVPGKPVLRIARDALEATVRGRRYTLPTPVPPALATQRAGAFVTVVKQGKLRACWGTLEPQHANLAEEVAASAQGACSRDTRFPPLRVEELPSLRLIVTIVLSPPQPALETHIRPREQGVLVRSGARSAVVLPHEGRTVRRMLTLAREKAGIGATEPLEIYTFRVQTITE